VWINDILDVLQTLVIDFISFRQNIYLLWDLSGSRYRPGESLYHDRIECSFFANSLPFQGLSGFDVVHADKPWNGRLLAKKEHSILSWYRLSPGLYLEI
jgi:hypothetical protein